MTAQEVRAIVQAEIGSDWSRSNSHGVDLRSCLVQPRKVVCQNTFPQLNKGKPLELWIVLEEEPGSKECYFIVFDERKYSFGLAYGSPDKPAFNGYYGTFLAALAGM